VTWACAEAVGIFGLVLFLVSGRVALALAFVAGNALLLALHSPRERSPG
jgi:hypothetical protein